DGFEIELFFVDPPAMGQGVGGNLFKALIGHAKKRRIKTLSILSDPQAAPFYEKMGARQVGTAPSDAIAGRRLPLLQITIC
ncbi:MAG: GNAT family N-acetyltransferase, partial [Pseudomonadota bacterium]